MDKFLVVLLVFGTLSFVSSSELVCEDSPTAQACELMLHSNGTKCDTDQSFRTRCPCVCAQRAGAGPEIRDEDEGAESAEEAEQNCQDSLLDQEYQCELRFRADPTMCGLENILTYCPCTCRGRTGNQEVPESETIELTNPESVDSLIDDVSQNNVITPAACVDVPDSQMEYDCQFRIASNPQLCNDFTYRKMCRCTCTWFRNRATLRENVVQSLMTPDAVLPVISRTQDIGELCPDSPWSPLAGTCQIRASKGECSDIKVRAECPCTCAVPEIPNLEPNPPGTAHHGGHRTGCVNTASERLCSHYLANNMCESDYGVQYCKKTCDHCSEEPPAENAEPVVNLMPDVDQPSNETEPIPEAQEEPCKDKAPPRVCKGYKADGLCSSRWLFCQKTCEACSAHLGEDIVSVETESESEIELANDGDVVDDDSREEDVSQEIEVQMGDGLGDVDREEPEEEESLSCTDVLSPTICGNYVSTNQCRTQWPYCRLSCDACEGTPYLEDPQRRPEVPESDINRGNRCPECRRLVNNTGCHNLDIVVREYCQNNCDLCLFSEEMDGDLDEDEEDLGVPIDDEETLNRGVNPSDQVDENEYIAVPQQDDGEQSQGQVPTQFPVQSPGQGTARQGEPPQTLPQQGQPEEQGEDMAESEEEEQGSGEEPVEVIDVNPATSTPEECRDVAVWCEEYKDLCDDDHHGDDMRTNKCRKTCGAC